MSEKITEGTEVTVHYIGRFEDGSEFDNSYTRDTPLTFKVGENQMIPGFESAILNRESKEVFDVTIPPKEAYGDYSESNVHEVPLEKINLPENAPVGSKIEGTAPNGEKFLCTLKEVKESVAVLDLNHVLAGKNLNFKIEILDIKSPDNNDKEEKIKK
jgi:peptidylprolyl isomerase